MDAQVCNELHEQLLQERERISGEIDHIRGGGTSSERFLEDEQDNVDQHPADDGSEMFEREKNLTVQRTLEYEIGEIDAALARFENGTYGLCEACGKPIPEKRLRAYPAATRDVECQSKLERTGRATAGSA